MKQNYSELPNGYLETIQNGIAGVRPKALQLPDSASTDYFDYKITATKFVATSKVQLENCPAGTKWSVFSNTKGLFDKELTLYRKPPQDTACVKLLPEFKNLGRK